MSCDPETVVSTAEIANAKSNFALFKDVAESVEDTTTTPDGKVIDTLLGRLKKLGWQTPPVAYTSGISFTTSDGTKIINRSGINYAPVPSELPFTTTGTWGGGDEDKFYPLNIAADSIGGLSGFTFATVATMATKTTIGGDVIALSAGLELVTTGHGLAGDGGAGSYLVKTSAQASSDGDVIDDRINHTLPDGFVAILKVGSSVNILQSGAAGDGVENTTPFYESASAVSNIVIFPGGKTWEFTTTPTLAANVSGLFTSRSSLTGITPTQAKAVFFDGGAFNGYGHSPELAGEKVHLIAGTIRQNAGDRTQWDWIQDAEHEPIGVDDSGSCTASGGTITVPLDRSFSKVLGVVCGADETLSNALNFTVGPSVGLSTLELKGSVSATLAASIYYDGSAWQTDFGPGQGGSGAHNINISSVTWNSNQLEITHDWCPGLQISLTPHMRAGSTPGYPYIPMLYSTTSSDAGTSYQTIVRFVDYTGAVVTAEDALMSFVLSKAFNEGIRLDGTSGTDALDLSSGNIWFVGFMQE